MVISTSVLRNIRTLPPTTSIRCSFPSGAKKKFKRIYSTKTLLEKLNVFSKTDNTSHVNVKVICKDTALYIRDI